ncbi:hypothetical protein GGR53DRAFT_533013 [Hypoxylon sp. FL1150]|nr:hypothetical protein GGR53DRAFT_533013 [Hypoxylon sp. FL1150]
MSASNDAAALEPLTMPIIEDVVQNVREKCFREYRYKFTKTMLDVYECAPADLFTYGLRINPYDEDTIIRDLIEILPHEAFGGNVTKLRWLLQLVISKRVKDHVPPVGSISRQEVEKLRQAGIDLREGGPRVYNEAILAMMLAAWYATVADMSNDMRPLVSELHGFHGEEQETTDDEKIFFIIKRQDIQNIKTCLDNLHARGVYRLAVGVAHTEYLLASLRHWDLLQPGNPTINLEYVEAFNIGYRRRALANGLPDVPWWDLDACYWRSERCDARLWVTMTRYDDSWCW